MKKLLSLISVFALMCVFGIAQLNAQTTEIQQTKDVVVKKSVVERKQATSIQRTTETDQNNTVVNEVKETQTTPVSTEKSTEVKKCPSSISTTNCQKKCTTPCHKQETNETEKKPVPKF